MTLRIGIDLGGTKIAGAALDSNGQMIAQDRVPTPQGDYDGTLAAIAGIVSRLEADVGVDCTVGVGIPGAISPATGVVKNANSTWLIGRPFGDDLEKAIGRPPRVENDANCFAISEAVDGAAAGAHSMFGVILGTGVGGGLVIGGQPVVGANAIAGEWGHNPLPWPADDERPGRKCYCGQSGCIETYLSGPSMSLDHLAATGESLAANEISENAAAGDTGADATLTRYEIRLARALATIVNVLDPEIIVLGGGLSNICRLYKNVPVYLARFVFSDVIATRLLPPLHGDSSGVRGAACLWPATAQS